MIETKTMTFLCKSCHTKSNCHTDNVPITATHKGQEINVLVEATICDICSAHQFSHEQALQRERTIEGVYIIKEVVSNLAVLDAKDQTLIYTVHAGNEDKLYKIVPAIKKASGARAVIVLREGESLKSMGKKELKRLLRKLVKEV